MEPPSGDVSLEPGLWYVVKSRGLEVAVGQPIDVKRSDNGWQFLRPAVGNEPRYLDSEIGSFRGDRTTVTTAGQLVTITNKHVGIALVLSKLPWGDSEQPRTLSRVFKGKPEATAQLMRDETARLEPHGYVAVSQQYVQGQWGSGAFLAALVLCVVLIGLLIFVYMRIVKPEGTLTVTYEHRVQPDQILVPTTSTQAASVSAPPAATDVSAAALAGAQAATKICPQCAETVKAATLICRYCRYEFGQLPPAGQPGTPP